MQPLFFNKRRSRAGLTLIEVTLVIALLLSLISILFVGVSAYLEGSNRAHCVQNIAAVQKAVRSYANLAGYNPGDSVTGLETRLIGPGTFLPAAPTCKSGGTYTFGGDTIPATGVAYLDCSITTHAPSTVAGW